ncbi:MAG TPA: tetratricopeptide repeat protein [Gemmatimonadales bacterium]|nr:tetratricopeptide repeat protein [Gemmatimonadales bacterium]
MKRAAVILAAAVLAACRAVSDHERLGDRRYAEAAWVDAAAEYRMALRQGRDTPELRVKAAQASMRAGQLELAARAWLELARRNAEWRGDAIEGLARTARLALDARDQAALTTAVEALGELAPSRLVGLGAVSRLAAGGTAVSPELLLVAAATQSTRLATDTLLTTWAELVAARGNCALARRAYAAIARRSGTTSLARQARAGQASCEVVEGRAALAAGDLESARLAFETAIALAGPDSTTRLAWLLLGDTFWADGDTTHAASAYNKAIEGGEPESPLVQRAQEQLRRLLGTQPPE